MQDPQRCAVVADALVKTYPGGVRALDGPSLAVEPGEVFGLLGPNGAGKSTIIKILTTLARPDSGTAWVAGHDVLRTPDRVRRVIGVVAHRSGADPMATGRDNLLLQGRLYGLAGGPLRRRVGELTERFDLAEAAGRAVRTYSGGMQRRLDVALGLVHRPRVLFLDEPTTGLDPQARLPALCRAALRRRRRRAGAEHDRSGGMNIVTQTWWMTVRRLKALLRQPGVLIITLVQPAIWLFLFGALFRKVVELPGFGSSSYLDYLIPGVVVMNAVSTNIRSTGRWRSPGPPSRRIRTGHRWPGWAGDCYCSAC